MDIDQLRISNNVALDTSKDAEKKFEELSRELAHLRATLEAAGISMTEAPVVDLQPGCTPKIQATISKKDGRWITIYNDTVSRNDISIIKWDLKVEAKLGERELSGSIKLNNDLLLRSCWCWTRSGRTEFG